MTMRRIALIGALLLLPIAALAHLKVGPGIAGIPAMLCQSAVAVPHTGDTAETALATCTVPANSMGPNGTILVNAYYSNNNSANNKTPRIRFSGAAGTVYSTINQTTNLSIRFVSLRISNRNATNSQVGFPNAGVLISAAAPTTSAIDTTVDTTIVFSTQLANAGDTNTLESYSVEVIRGN